MYLDLFFNMAGDLFGQNISSSVAAGQSAFVFTVKLHFCKPGKLKVVRTL